MPLPRFQRVVNSFRGKQAIDASAGLPERTLADVLGGFSQQQARIGVANAVDQAGQEGLNAGLTSTELPQESNLTAASRAFNQAARVGHVAGIKRDIKTRLGELAIQANALPAEQRVDAFIDTADGFREGLMGEVDPSMLPIAEEYFSEESSGLRLKILAGQQGDLQRQVGVDIEIGQKQLLDDIDSAARELNEPLLTKRQREYESLVGSAIEGGFLSEGQGDAAIKSMHSVAVMGEVLGAFDQVLEGEGTLAAEESLDRFKRAKGSDLGLSAQEKDALETTMTGLFNRQRSFEAQAAARNEAGNKALEAQLIQSADNAIASLKAGFPVDVETIANQLVLAEKPGKLVDLQDALRVQSQLAPVLSSAPDVQTALLRELQSKGRAGELKPGAIQFLNALEGVERESQRLIATDPRALARQQNIIENDIDLDFTDSGTLSASIQTRLLGTELASEHYGFDVPVLYDNEVAQFGRFWASADIAGKLSLAAAISEGLGADAEQIFSKLEKKDFRTAAFTGQLVADGDTEVAESILRGKEIQSTDIMPEGTEKNLLDSHISERLGAAFSHIPQFRQTVVDSIQAVYADRSSIDGDFTREFDNRRIDQAISAVIGQVVEDPTGSETAFRDGDQDSFDDWLFSIDAETVAAAGGVQGFTNEAAADLIKRSRFSAMGPGEFWITTPNPDSTLPGFLMNEAGEPLRLMFSAGDAQAGGTARKSARAAEVEAAAVNF